MLSLSAEILGCVNPYYFLMNDSGLKHNCVGRKTTRVHLGVCAECVSGGAMGKDTITFSRYIGLGESKLLFDEWQWTEAQLCGGKNYQGPFGGVCWMHLCAQNPNCSPLWQTIVHYCRLQIWKLEHFNFLWACALSYAHIPYHARDLRFNFSKYPQTDAQYMKRDLDTSVSMIGER